MTKCVICGGNASALSQKRCMDGLVCQNCMDRIPKVLHGMLFSYGADELSTIAVEEDRLRGNAYQPTASYGKIYLDELNGVFAVGEKSGMSGPFDSRFDVFEGAFLESIGLYPIDPRQARKDVICEVEFACVFRYPRMKFKVKVKSGVKCDFKQVAKTKAEWMEPGDLSMFRNMLDQTVKTSVKKAMEQRERVLTPYDLDLFKARACLHVYEGCANEMIENQYANMVRMYRNGNYSKEEADAFIQSLDHYRRLLLSSGGDS